MDLVRNMGNAPAPVRQPLPGVALAVQCSLAVFCLWVESYPKKKKRGKGEKGTKRIHWDPDTACFSPDSVLDLRGRAFLVLSVGAIFTRVPFGT